MPLLISMIVAIVSGFEFVFETAAGHESLAHAAFVLFVAGTLASIYFLPRADDAR